MTKDPVVTTEHWRIVCANADPTHREHLEGLADQIVGKPVSMAPAVLARSLAELTGMSPEDALREVDPPPRLRWFMRGRQ